MTSFEVNISERAKIVLLDLIMDQSTDAQHMVKDMMGDAFENWLLEKLGKKQEESVEEPAEEVPLEQVESSE